MLSFRPLPDARATSAAGWVGGALAWALAWALMLGLDEPIDLAHQALLLVLGGAVAALWWPAGVTLAAGAVAVLAFNALLVPPRGSLAVSRWQDGLLLALMAGTLTVVVGLIVRLRRQAGQAQLHQARAEQLRQLGDALRDAGEPLAHAGALQQSLAALTGAPAALLLCRAWPLADDQVAAIGSASEEETAGLWHGLRQGRPMGPGTGRHGDLAHWILPLRGAAAAEGSAASVATFGAALLRLPGSQRHDDALRAHAQALCDQLGTALQRGFSRQAAEAATAQAQLQAVRNALLTAISHDYRTPLATILGAASSLQDQGQRLDPTQRATLAGRIVQEAEHLARLADNTLQLARLDAPGVVLRRDWESAEDLVGTVMRRARQRAPDRQLRARLEPGLPLLHCDAMLLTQLLDNLVDNALRHTPADTPVELLVRRATGGPAEAPAGVVLAVRDRGPGVAPAWRERIFEVFQRAEPAAGAAPARSGTGVGLAVCRAIARAHGGELKLRPRNHGGSSFECHLPGAAQPTPAEGTR